MAVWLLTYMICSAHPFEHGGGVTKCKSDKIVMRSYDVCAAERLRLTEMLKAAPNAFGTAACVPWEPDPT